MKLPELAISIQQPWVELILRGVKKAEYRSTLTRITGRILLHASKTPADSPEDWADLGKKPGELPTGRIVGSVEIVDCRWDARRKSYAYVLANPRRMRPHLVASNQPLPKFWKPRIRRSGN